MGGNVYGQIDFMKTNIISSRLKTWLMGLVPIALLGLLLFSFLKYGPLGVFEKNFPPIEEIFIERVLFETEEITLKIFNDGPEDVTVSQALINDVVWQFTMIPDNILKPLESSEIKFFYPWIEAEPLNFTLIASDGVTFEKEVPVPFLTPVPDVRYVKTFVLLGLYVGVIPVLLGLLWFPFLRRLRGNAYMFLLSLTVGLLLFLGFDTLAESIELINEVPQAFNGVGVLVIGFVLAVLILGLVSYKTERHITEKGDHFKTLVWAYLIALGIGLHNMGEGLAIGSAYAIGEIALGGTLVIGFMVHNVTEGLAIVAPLTRETYGDKKFLGHILIMGILAGVPTIIGTLIGGFAYSPVLAIFFLAIGSGAIFDVTFDILHYMAAGKWRSLFSATNVLGFLGGLFVMYATGLLVLG